MEKTSFTSPGKNQGRPVLRHQVSIITLFIGLMFTLFIQRGMSQCSLACNGLVQVSLDQNCQATITAAMILNDTFTLCPGGNYVVTVLQYKKPIPTSPVVTGFYAGQTLQVEIKDTRSGNKCWGDLKIEDKLPPIIECGRDTIPCFYASTFVPIAYDGCELDTVILINEIIRPYECHPDFVKQIVRTYIARDIYGNTSTPCNDTIELKRFDTARVICPKDWTIANNCPISCKDISYKRIKLDKNGHPHPDYTGTPRYWDTISRFPVVTDTVSIWPVKDIYCNIGVTYEDIDLGTISCVRKIMRLWTMREWHCRGEIVRVCIQILEIADREAPFVHCGYNFQVTTDGGYRCEATVTLPPAIVFDSCLSTIRVDVVYPGGILLNKNGGTVTLPVGENVIWYRAYDKCYNVDSCFIIVTVLDKTAPVAVCDRTTVVSLSIDGRAHVYAKTFDDGSYDDCHIKEFLVRRMFDGPCDNDLLVDSFRPYVEFCCEDVGNTIMIVFRVVDKSGNINECMVEIEVQDKLKPVCHAPKDLTVSCDFHFDINDLSVFGVVQTDSAFFNKKRTIRYRGFDWTRDTIINFHDGFAHDNCDLTVTTWFVDNRTQCNVGTIERFWEVRDANGVDTCRQVITIFNWHPFDLDNDIIWPNDTTLFGCLSASGLTPETLGRPRAINEDKCDLLGFSWEDHTFRFVNGSDACFKILRKWKAIDWCQRLYSPVFGFYFHTVEFTQVIKVHNVVKPVVTTNPTQDTTFCTFDSCTSGLATLTAIGIDDCTPASELFWEYLIDLDSDGDFDIIRNGIGNVINATGRYKLGVHRIKYVFEDRCGNKTAVERGFTIVNCKAPTPYCLNGVAIDLMPMDLNNDGIIDTAMITVWASDLDHGSTGACGHPVVFSFSSDSSDHFRTFTCPPRQENVEIWVTDVITGKQSFCITFIDIQDNNNACSGNIIGGRISGLIATDDKQGIISAEVELKGSGLSKFVTPGNGKYAFINMPFSSTSQYEVIPSRNDNPLNGVTTADIVRIQRHILGIEEFDTPYKRIAADINASKTITSTDISELRKLILGIITKFEKNTSWVFVDANYQFLSPDDDVLKETYPRTYVINPFISDMIANFKGIKIGDLNGSVVASNFNKSGSRNRTILELLTNELSFNAQDEVIVPVQVMAKSTIAGYQFTLKFDPRVLEFVGVNGGASNIQDEHIGTSRIQDGFLTFSWNNNDAIVINENENVFTLKFKALSKGQISNYVHINSAITSAEAYNANLEEMDVQLSFRTQTGIVADAVPVLYQNQPNPFSDQTVIGFEMPKANHATLSVYDLNSKIVFKTDLNAAKGYNSITIKNSQLGVTGVLFYQLDTEGYTTTRRMVVIQ
ncbi:MAG: cohesin domain-containing protein [Bacteroidota bacterium]|nr:cohesin domain-containing protein [Bacteroidota bacterium]